jgi:1-acyl-sn-glycerol-3-phosphate acyltransferase
MRAEARDSLVASILAFLADRDLLTREDIRAALEREIDASGPAALIALEARLAADLGWTYYPPDPLARRIHHLLADRLLDPASSGPGDPDLREWARPTIICANHLSYADANLVEILFVRSGLDSVAARLTAIAGPKVFTSRRRRFSSLCFGTIKVPQSADVSSGEAAMPAREVARAARLAIRAARDRVDAGDALLLFAEGTRSRTGGMQRLLAGAARYLEAPGLQVVPAGITGSERLFPVDAGDLRPARVSVRLGRPVDAAALLARTGRDRQAAMDAIGLAIAELVPPEYRGVYSPVSEMTARRTHADHQG